MHSESIFFYWILLQKSISMDMPICNAVIAGWAKTLGRLILSLILQQHESGESWGYYRLNITQTQSTRNDWVSWKYQQLDHHWNSKRYKTSKGSGASMKDVIENGFSTVWGNWAGSFNEEIQSVGEVMTIPSSLVKETWWGRRQQILEFVLWDFTTSGDMASSAL